MPCLVEFFHLNKQISAFGFLSATADTSMRDKITAPVGGSGLIPSRKRRGHLGVLLLPNQIHALLCLSENLLH